MRARLADRLERLLERLLDLVWDVTEPLAGRCPVCAFWRGALAGAAAGAVALCLAGPA